jgi:hypothetical protein
MTLAKTQREEATLRRFFFESLMVSLQLEDGLIELVIKSLINFATLPHLASLRELYG